MQHARDDRRLFLLTAGAASAGALLTACVDGKKDAEDVSPAEDLMREHGVLRRVLLVYEEIARRVDHQEPYPAEALVSASGIVRRFVEDYHEKLEEDFVFPYFEKARKQVDLVTVLRQQHQAGRRLTETVQGLAKSSGAQGADGRPKLAEALRAFIRMYRPHAAREDTDLFPGLRPLLGAREYDALGEKFEDKEHALFGPQGFEGVVAEVAQIEKGLGIEDLASFTPTSR